MHPETTDERDGVGGSPRRLPGVTTLRTAAGPRRSRPPWRCAISTDPTGSGPQPPSPLSWAYADEWLAESDLVAGARSRAQELGAPPVATGTGATLAVLAAALGARAVVEVGTGAGVSGAWLLAGMSPDGVLTTIDVEAEHQRVARETFHAIGIDHTRTRLITGRALEVVPRLQDGAYDLVFIDGEKTEYPALLEQAVRLLRPGGMVVFDNVLWGDRVADPAHRDAETVALREVTALVRDDERLIAALLPVGDGLLAAVKRPDGAA